MINARDALAKTTSLSVIVPTPPLITVTFTPSIGVFYIESYKKYNKIDCKYKKENLKNFNKSKRVGCSCEIL